jgi:hypothetical protein
MNYTDTGNYKIYEANTSSIRQLQALLGNYKLYEATTVCEAITAWGEKIPATDAITAFEVIPASEAIPALRPFQPVRPFQP